MEDNRKYIVLSLISLGVVCAEVIYRMLTTGVVFLRMSMSHFIGNLSWEIVGRGGSYLICIVIVIVLYRNQKVFDFLNEVCMELRKVTWPGGRETAASTVLVVIMVVVSAVVLATLDWFWFFVFHTVLR